MDKIIKIIPPEGYEVDKVNSSFEQIVFKKKCLTYDYIYTKLYGNIGCTPTYLSDKILSINKLFIIAEYYNNGWKPNFNDTTEQKYFITKNNFGYIIYSRTSTDAGIPYFKNEKDAEEVINNPNFKKILDNIFD